MLSRLRRNAYSEDGTGPVGRRTSGPALRSSKEKRELSEATKRSRLPSTVDLRPRLASVGLEVRCQKPRGACSVFTFVGAIEYALSMKAPIGRLSVEFANWASNAAKDEKDDGDFFCNLLKGFEQHGICLECQMPYRAKFDPDLEPSAAALETAGWAKRQGIAFHWLKSTHFEPGLTREQFLNVKRVIASGWPVLGGFCWTKKPAWKYDNMINYYPRKDMILDSGGHSMLLVGYANDNTHPGGGVFILRDSGDGKCGYMPYAHARDYLMDHGWFDFGEPLEYPVRT